MMVSLPSLGWVILHTNRQNSGESRPGGRILSSDLAVVSAGAVVRDAAPRHGQGQWCLVVDLGRGIGSPRWFRGLGTCSALCWAAISLAPADEHHGAFDFPAEEAAVKELDSASFSPVADGASVQQAVATSNGLLELARALQPSTTKLSVVIPEAGSVTRALRDSGLSETQAGAVSTLIQELVPHADRPGGASLHLEFGRRISKDQILPLEKLSYRSALGTKVTLRKDGGSWRLASTGMPVETTSLKITGNAEAGPDEDGPESPMHPIGARSHTSFARPVPGPVTSGFGFRRHPILGYWRMHNGIDIRAAYGTPILAAADGRVGRAGWAGGRGKEVRLVHSDGVSTSYSHMSEIVVGPGDTIRQNDLIGFAGSTGLSTGSHVHFEVRRHGRPEDPQLLGWMNK